MPEFFTRIILNILSGHVRIFKIIGSFMLRIILLFFFSFVIVFPQWYFAIHYKLGYNIFIFVFLLSIILFTTGVKIFRYFAAESRRDFKTGFGLPVFLRFIILVLELYLIRYLLLNDQILFMVPGILLVCEFLFFLCLIKENKEILISWMKTVLIILTSFEMIYTVSVLFTRGNRLYALSLAIIFLLAIGYLLYNPGKFKRMKASKRL